MTKLPIKVCVVDHGLFLPLARKLGELCDKVYYTTPAERCMPVLKDGCIGDGFEEIERVESLWKVKHQADLFVFPDVGFASEQHELVEQGFPVWGHHGADELETNRGKFLRALRECGLDCPRHTEAVGFENLKAVLRGMEDVWIKVSKWRGNWETFHFRTWAEDGDELTARSLAMGPVRERIMFYVFPRIDSDLEDGIDTYCIDGNLPSTVIHGLEHKDKSYLCAVQTVDQIPDWLVRVSEIFSERLERCAYRSFFSTEVRKAGDKAYFIDPTLRAASPTSQVQCELFSNLADILYTGAQGTLLEPRVTAKYGVQALISQERGPEEWIRLNIPDEIDQWCKFSFACRVNGQVCLAPSDLGNMLGWLVAIGDTIQEAIEQLKAHRELLPEGLECDVESIAHLLTEAEAAKSEGVRLGKLPQPSTVLEQ